MSDRIEFLANHREEETLERVGGVDIWLEIKICRDHAQIGGTPKAREMKGFSTSLGRLGMGD